MTMANNYINIYKNNPTAGGTDGTAVSTNGDFTSPINFKLDASQNQTQTVKLAIRTEPDYITDGATTISDNGDTGDHIKLCLTENGTFTDSITISTPIDDTNTIFYVRASSTNDELPHIDRDVSLKVSCFIAMV